MIVLVGFMGAGKSTIGRLLAGHLGLPFVDTDSAIESRAGRTIKEIFATDGEPAFRVLEHEVIADLLRGPDAVIALGGGAPEHVGTRDELAETKAEVVYLEVSYEDALGRLGQDTDRPLLAQPGLLARYQRRVPVYAAVATCKVRTGGRDPGAIARDILASLTPE